VSLKNFVIKVPEDGVNDAETMQKRCKVIFLSVKCVFIGVWMNDVGYMFTALHSEWQWKL